MCIRDRYNTLLKTINVAGKLPHSLNRSSPKTIGLEYSTNQGCMKTVSYTHLDVYKRQWVQCDSATDSLHRSMLANTVNYISS